MTALRTVSLLAATLTMGLAAGAFVLYAHAIMPGLKETDDRTFVNAFGSIDRAIINPWFMAGGFLGALAFTVAAVLAHRGGDALPWIAGALVLYAIAFVITLAVNVPLNDALKAATDPNLAAVRDQFNETRWAGWNLVRAITSTAAFGCLMWALVVYGRSSA